MVPRTFSFDGIDYRVSTFTPRDLGELQGILREQIPNPIAAIKPYLAGLDLSIQTAMVLKAQDQARNWPPSLDDEEGWRFFALGPGRARFVHIALRKQQPNLSIEQAQDMADRMDITLFNRLSLLAFGKDPDDPKSKAEEETAEKTGTGTGTE
jgi:hypothetical protein